LLILAAHTAVSSNLSVVSPNFASWHNRAGNQLLNLSPCREIRQGLICSLRIIVKALQNLTYNQILYKCSEFQDQLSCSAPIPSLALGHCEVASELAHAFCQSLTLQGWPLATACIFSNDNSTFWKLRCMSSCAASTQTRDKNKSISVPAH
jgi:hypothetical protein